MNKKDVQKLKRQGDFKNNLAGYQTDIVNKRAILIAKYLSEQKKKKIQFKNITGLATSIAQYITKEEGGPCDKSTLLRKKVYKNFIDTYFYGQEATKKSEGCKKGNPIAVFNAELSASNSEREVVRLKQYIAGLEKENELLKQGKGTHI